jgi:hypothetical protein
LTAGGNLAPSEYTIVPFTAPRAGTVTIQVSWGGDGNVDMYLTDQNCSEFPLNNVCPLKSMAQTASANPEQITRTVTAGEQFKVWVANRPIFITHYNTLNYTVTVKIP